MDLDEAAVVNMVMNDLVEAEENANGVRRHYYNNRINPLVEMNEAQFIQMFRLNKNLTQRLINLVTPFMEEGQTNNSLDIRTKVLVALVFFGHGSYQKVTGKNIFCGISQPSVSRCIREVSVALNEDNIINQWINFPHNLNELQELRARFFRKHNFPGVVGCVDCTHIAIVAPNEDEHIFVNRKNYHSLNVQLICDENLKIMNVVERFPGSTHDAHIWRQSNMSQLMEAIYHRNNENLFFLLGDSGYPLRPWLLTPLRDTIPGTPEDRFNTALKSVRSIIERCNGVLKNRFRCLLKHRVLHYSPEMAAKIIKACCVLHNMCVSDNIDLPVAEDVDVDYGIVNNPYQPENNANADLVTARHIQQQIINNHFV